MLVAEELSQAPAGPDGAGLGRRALGGGVLPAGATTVRNNENTPERLVTREQLEAEPPIDERDGHGRG